MPDVGHFGCANLTFDRISGHFRSIRNLNFFWNFWQTGWRRPFWMCEFNFRSHFWPFSDRYATLFFFEFFYKMADVGHFGCLNFTFDRISGHFRSIRNLIFFWNFLTKWLTLAILDVQNQFRSISLSIAFLAISDRYATLFFFENCWQNDWRWPFWMSKFTFDLISIHFTSICWRRPFWMSEFHLRSHFWPIFFRSIRNFNFFLNFWQNGCRRPFWMSKNHFLSHFWPFHIDWPFWIFEIHFRSQFWPFQINTEFCFFRWPFWMSENHLGSHFWPFQIDRPFWMSEIHFRWHFWPFQILNFIYCFKFLTKWPPATNFGCPQITFDRIFGHFRSIRNFLFNF